MEKIIMVVDDQKDERKLVRLLLRKYAVTVVEASNPVEAMKLARQQKPHLILMDHVMPQMTGYEAVSALKQDPELCRIPIIMLSARKFDPEWGDFIRQSVEDFLPKPAQADKLLARIQALLGALTVRLGNVPA
ncbi:MAG: response regulator [Elusimicrobia bacterium]|nr:response regulator [Elusimicrobiota bacterium]